MSYASIASTIKGHVSTLGEGVSSVKGVSFDGVWSGDAYSNLSSDLETVIKKIDTQKKALSNFVDALNKLDKYKKNDEEISSKRSTLSSLADTPENASKISNLRADISSLEKENTTLKSDIKSLISGISSVSSEIEIVEANISTDYEGYVVDLADMLALFRSGSLTQLSDYNQSSNSLYDYYSKEDVESMLSEIKQKYTGRDAAVNCALGIMKMASDVGVKLDYDWGGGHTAVANVDSVANGVDCSGFASWVINQGSSEDFRPRGTVSLVNVGKKISYEEAQKGDILVYNTNGSGHVIMIIDNNPETQQFLVAEAAGSNTGVIMQTRSYSSLSGTYAARDLSGIYNV